MSAIRTLSALVLGGLLLAGCSGAPAEPAPAAPVTEPHFQPLAWDEIYTYADGSTLTIAKPTDWESPVYTDEDMDGIDDDPDDTDPRRMVKVTFTLTNNTPQPISGIALGTLNAFVAIDNVPAEEIQPDNYMELRGFDGVPILPGRSGVVETVWAAPEFGFTMTAGWSYLGETAIFEAPVAAGSPETAEPARTPEPPAGPEPTVDNSDETDEGLIMPENDPNFVPPPCSATVTESCMPTESGTHIDTEGNERDIRDHPQYQYACEMGTIPPEEC